MFLYTFINSLKGNWKYMLMRCWKGNSWEKGRDKELGRRWTLGIWWENNKVNSICKYAGSRGRQHLLWGRTVSQKSKQPRLIRETITELREVRLCPFFHPHPQALPISCHGSFSLREFVATIRPFCCFFQSWSSSGYPCCQASPTVSGWWPEPPQRVYGAS